MAPRCENRAEKSDDIDSTEQVPIEHRRNASDYLSGATSGPMLGRVQIVLDILATQLWPLRDEESLQNSDTLDDIQNSRALTPALSWFLSVMTENDLTYSALKKELISPSSGSIHMFEQFYRELLTNHLPISMNFDSWVGQILIRAVAFKFSVNWRRVVSTDQFKNKYIYPRDDSSKAARQAWPFAEPLLKKRGRLIYLPCGHGHDADLNFAELYADFYLIRKILYRFMVHTSKFVYEATVRYNIGYAATDPKPGPQHTTFCSSEMVRYYVRRVLGQRWYRLPFADEFPAFDGGMKGGDLENELMSGQMSGWAIPRYERFANEPPPDTGLAVYLERLTKSFAKRTGHPYHLPASSVMTHSGLGISFGRNSKIERTDIRSDRIVRLYAQSAKHSNKSAKAWVEAPNRMLTGEARQPGPSNAQTSRNPVPSVLFRRTAARAAKKRLVDAERSNSQPLSTGPVFPTSLLPADEPDAVVRAKNDANVANVAALQPPAESAQELFRKTGPRHFKSLLTKASPLGEAPPNVKILYREPVPNLCDEDETDITVREQRRADTLACLEGWTPKILKAPRAPKFRRN